MAKEKSSDGLEKIALAIVIVAITAAAVALIIAGDGVWVIWFAVICSLIFF